MPYEWFSPGLWLKSNHFERSEMLDEVWGISSFSCASPPFLFHFRKSRKNVLYSALWWKDGENGKSEKVEKGLLFESWVEKSFFCKHQKVIK